MSLKRKTASGVDVVAGPGTSALTPTHTPLSGGSAVSALTMRVANVQRTRDPIPGKGPFTPLVEEFTEASLFTTRYDVANASGTVSTETVNRGVLALAATAEGALDRIYRARTKLAVPNGVFTAIRVEPGHSGGSYVCCGFYETGGSAADFVQAQWNLSTGAVDIAAGTGATPVALSGGGGTADTVSGPTTAPMWLGLILSYPSAHVVTSNDGHNWDLQISRDVAPPSGGNWHDEATWSQFLPGFRLVPAASSAVKISEFRTGYAGPLGYRDFKPVTYDDGQPLRKGGRYFMTGTVANGTASFSGNHMAVFSVDPYTYAVELVRHLYYRLTGTGTGAGYGGQMVYEPSTGKWLIVANSWGFDTQSTGVDLIYAESTDDLLAPGVSVLKADRMSGLSDFSLYDSSFRKENGVWKLTAIETTVRTGWTANQHGPSLWAGASLTGAMTRQATRVNNAVDGVCWMKVNGSWVVVGGGSSAFLAWDENLANEVTLTSWATNLPSGLLTFGGFPAHPAPLVVDDGDRTRYLSVTYDSSLIGGFNATRGGCAVLEADEKPSGQEFAPRLVPAYVT